VLREAARAQVTAGRQRAFVLLEEALQLVPYQATFARLTMRRRRGSAVWRFRQAM